MLNVNYKMLIGEIITSDYTRFVGFGEHAECVLLGLGIHESYYNDGYYFGPTGYTPVEEILDFGRIVRNGTKKKRIFLERSWGNNIPQKFFPREIRRDLNGYTGYS